MLSKLGANFRIDSGARKLIFNVSGRCFISKVDVAEVSHSVHGRIWEPINN